MFGSIIQNLAEIFEGKIDLLQILYALPWLFSQASHPFMWFPEWRQLHEISFNFATFSLSFFPFYQGVVFPRS